jgi:iron complex outermembrane receptor protein
VEWYLSKVNYISATAWRKDIKGFLIKRQPRKPTPISPLPFTVSTYYNNPSPIQINGAEIGVQYGLDFLPKPFKNMGVQANYTYAKDKGFTTAGYYSGLNSGFPGLSRHSERLGLL